MILNYQPEGNLRDYLQNNHPNLTLKDRIRIFLIQSMMRKYLITAGIILTIVIIVVVIMLYTLIH